MHITQAPATGRGAAAVAYAEAKLGDEYVYAGAGPDVYDCSGLTMMAWAAAGVSLPHNAAAQYDDTVHVSVDDLVPGDLLFYDYGEGITHVAIYVGNGMAVHAPHTGTVVQYGQINNIGPLVGASDPALGVSCPTASTNPKGHPTWRRSLPSPLVRTLPSSARIAGVCPSASLPHLCAVTAGPSNGDPGAYTFKPAPAGPSHGDPGAYTFRLNPSQQTSGSRQNSDLRPRRPRSGFRPSSRA